LATTPSVSSKDPGAHPGEEPIAEAVAGTTTPPTTPDSIADRTTLRKRLILNPPFDRRAIGTPCFVTRQGPARAFQSYPGVKGTFMFVLQLPPIREMQEIEISATFQEGPEHGA
jgi:hypothetical protein